MTMFDLTGRTALITGSGKGIGFGLARGLGQAGARIVLNGRDATRLAQAAEILRGEGLSAALAPFDAADPEAAADRRKAMKIHLAFG